MNFNYVNFTRTFQRLECGKQSFHQEGLPVLRFPEEVDNFIIPEFQIRGCSHWGCLLKPWGWKYFSLRTQVGLYHNVIELPTITLD